MPHLSRTLTIPVRVELSANRTAVYVFHALDMNSAFCNAHITIIRDRHRPYIHDIHVTQPMRHREQRPFGMACEWRPCQRYQCKDLNCCYFQGHLAFDYGGIAMAVGPHHDSDSYLADEVERCVSVFNHLVNERAGQEYRELIQAHLSYQLSHRGGAARVCEACTLKQLRDVARAQGITGFSKKNKKKSSRRSRTLYVDCLAAQSQRWSEAPDTDTVQWR